MTRSHARTVGIGSMALVQSAPFVGNQWDGSANVRIAGLCLKRPIPIFARAVGDGGMRRWS